MIAIGKETSHGEVVVLSITSVAQNYLIDNSANSSRHKLNRMGSVAVFAKKV